MSLPLCNDSAHPTDQWTLLTQPPHHVSPRHPLPPSSFHYLLSLENVDDIKMLRAKSWPKVSIWVKELLEKFSGSFFGFALLFFFLHLFINNAKTPTS